MIDRPGPALLELIDRPALRLWAEIREGAGIDHVSCARKRTVVVFRPITPWSGLLFFCVLVLALKLVDTRSRFGSWVLWP